MSEIRTRFSPSPTGCLHIGSARTALFSWLFAKRNNGKFILRIEDTDIKRFIKDSIRSIMQGLNWLNLTWDEGPFFQTKRLNRYHEVIRNMLIDGTAYKCFCSQERLNSLRISQIKNGEKPKYDKNCLYNNKSNKFDLYTIRFRNPLDGIVEFTDMVYGNIKFKNEELDDLVICRSDGYPTYNFCTVIDDYDMKITHVIRGEDHINNTPRQINIFKALKISIPEYAHLPMIVSENKKKLSKRKNSEDILKYRKEGYLPEAIINYLIRLGWSCGNKEIFSLKEMRNMFNIKNIQKSSSSFDKRKLIWYNKYYIKHLPKSRIVKELCWHFKNSNISINTIPNLEKLIEFLRNRCKTLKEIVNNYWYLYQEEISLNKVIFSKYYNSSIIEILNFITKFLFEIDFWKLETIQLTLKKLSDDLKLHINEINMLLRIIFTGSNQSPPILEIMDIMGKYLCLKKISIAKNIILKKFMKNSSLQKKM